MKKQELLNKLRKINTGVHYDIQHLRMAIVKGEIYSDDYEVEMYLDGLSKSIILDQIYNLENIKKQLNEILWSK